MTRSKRTSPNEAKQNILPSQGFLDLLMDSGYPVDPSLDFEGLVHQLLEGEQRARLTAETLLQATAAINSTLDLKQVLDRILEQLQLVVQFDSASVMLIEAEQLRIQAVRGHPHPEAALNVAFSPQENPLAKEIIACQEPLVLADAQADPRYTRIGDAGYVRGWMGIPMLSRGQVIGLLTVDSCLPDAYNAKDAHLANAFAGKAALAVTNARLYESEREQRLLAQTLREFSLALSSTLKAEEVLEAVLHGIKSLVPYDSARVLLKEGDQVQPVIQWGYERYPAEDLVESQVLSIEEMPNLRRMSATLRSCLVPDVQADPGWVITGLSRHFGSWVGAPLVAHGRLLGFLSLEKEDRCFYTPKHAGLLESLAGHVGLALLNALTYGEMERASITDFLTGAYNHRYFQQQIRRELELAQRIGYPVSLLMLDLDFFKDVNDRFGHLCGDRVLQLLADRLRIELRNSDHLARYGGEEFAIILPGTPARAACEVGERLRRAVAAIPFQVDEPLDAAGMALSATIPLSVSIGAATFPDHSQGPRDLIAAADRALYRAKELGRNLVHGVE